MTTRRTALALLGLLPLGGLTLSACGSSADDLARSELSRAPVDPAVLRAPGSTRPTGSTAGSADPVTAFTADLYARLAAGAGNVVCSPYSVATALGMAVQGAKGRTAQEILRVLHADAGSSGPGSSGTGSTDAAAITRAVAAFADRLNALDQILASRAGEYRASDGKTEKVELSAANSLWGQRGMTWEKPFLDVLARDFGTGMRQVDYEHAADEARTAINRWVSERTHEKIPNLLAPGALEAATRLVLVNALYFKAGWTTPFEESATRPTPFTRLDGSTVEAHLMNASVTARFAEGPGWVAAALPYADGRLAMTVVLPDKGRFAAVEKALDADRLATLLRPGDAAVQKIPVRVGLPRWTSRTNAELAQALAGLGMPTAFGDNADFSGMTAQAALQIARVIHEGYIAVDEAGTEAAAATAVVMRVTSARVGPDKELIADRPFLYVIHDVETATPLFIGRVVDPTVTPS